MIVEGRSFRRAAAAAVLLLLVAPGALFMTALVVRELQPQVHEPAHSAQRIVMWYAARPWTLWVLLRALPLAALIIGGAALTRVWRDDADLRGAAGRTAAAIRAHLPTLLIAAATLAAAGILAVVMVHALLD
jgi:ABC-type Fe3+ transport system permease subunit